MARVRAGDLVSRSFSLAFGNLGAFLSTQGVLILALALLSLFVSVYAIPDVNARGIDAQAFAALAAWGVVFSVAASFVGVASAGVGLHVADGLLRGERSDLREALRRTWPRFWKIFLTFLVFFCVAVVVWTLIGVAISGASGTKAARLTTDALFATFPLLVPIVLLYLRWAIALPLAVFEGSGVRESLRRSADLTADSRAALLGAFLVVGLAAEVPRGIISLILPAFYGSVAPPFGARVSVWIAHTLASLAGAFLVSALGVLAYRDLTAAPPATEPVEAATPAPA